MFSDVSCRPMRNTRLNFWTWLNAVASTNRQLMVHDIFRSPIKFLSLVISTSRQRCMHDTGRSPNILSVVISTRIVGSAATRSGVVGGTRKTLDELGASFTS